MASGTRCRAERCRKGITTETFGTIQDGGRSLSQVDTEALANLVAQKLKDIGPRGAL